MVKSKCGGFVIDIPATNLLSKAVINDGTVIAVLAEHNANRSSDTVTLTILK